MKKNSKRLRPHKPSVFTRLYNYVFFIINYMLTSTLQMIQSYTATSQHASATTALPDSASVSALTPEPKLSPEPAENSLIEVKNLEEKELEQIKSVVSKIDKFQKSSEKPNISNLAEEMQPITLKPEALIKSPKSGNPKPNKRKSKPYCDKKSSDYMNKNSEKFEIIEPYTEVKKNSPINKWRNIMNIHNSIPREILYLICMLLDKNSKLNLRLVCKDLSKKMTIGHDSMSFFRPMNESKILHNIIGNNKGSLYEGPLSLFNIEMATPNLFDKLKNEIKWFLNKFLFNRTLKNDSIERKILNYIKEFLLDKNGNINDDILKKAITQYRHYLYRNNFIKYRVAFHVEHVKEKNSIAEVLENWKPSHPSGFSLFSVDSYTTFFYSRDLITRLGFMEKGYIMSMLVLPASKISDQMEYTDRTDFERSHTYASDNPFAKTKKIYIGNCIYRIDPGFLVAIFRADKVGKIIECRVNNNRHLGIDIAIKPEKIVLNEVAIQQYISNDFDMELELSSGMKKT